MEPLYLNRYAMPVTTGIVRPETGTTHASPKTGEEASSFQKLLEEKLNGASGVSFSKHAVNRVLERNIDLSDSNLARLNEGMRLAEGKGLNDTLILIDRTAFIVNVKNNKVITTVDNEDLKGNVFTNIDGTVVV